jgi:hypothetical protein
LGRGVVVYVKTMSELDELRSQNKELKRLLANALDLLEKSKLFLAGQAQSSPAAKSKKSSAGRSAAKKKKSSKPPKS